MRDFRVQKIADKTMQLLFYPHECGLSVPRLQIHDWKNPTTNNSRLCSSSLHLQRKTSVLTAPSKSIHTLSTSDNHISPSASTVSLQESINILSAKERKRRHIDVTPSLMSASVFLNDVRQSDLIQPNSHASQCKKTETIERNEFDGQNVVYEREDDVIVVFEFQSPSPPVTGEFTLVYTDNNGKQHFARGTVKVVTAYYSIANFRLQVFIALCLYTTSGKQVVGYIVYLLYFELAKAQTMCLRYQGVKDEFSA